MHQSSGVSGNSSTGNVVIVGGGIGGSGLASVLARRGVGVTVLERTTSFPDRVRGEMWCPWGVAIAQELGLVEPMLAAGAFFSTKWAFYDDAIPAAFSEEIAVDASSVLPGVPGILNMGHPRACQALFDHALEAGATMLRGITHVDIDTTGPTPVVQWVDEGGRSGEIVCSLVVGADGRHSSVRRQAGIELESEPVRQYISGLLVEGSQPLSSDIDSHGSGRDINWYSFPQGPASSRVYIAHFDVHRYSGSQGTARFLADLAQAASPDVAALAQGRPLSVPATYPGGDTWTPTPYAPGIVLVGDAAGHNDPIIGQGLSLTMADLRDVSRVILDGGRSVEDFVAYGVARTDRFAKQRVAAQTMAELMCAFGDDLAARRLRALPMLGTDPVAGLIAAVLFAGPEILPPGTDPLIAARELLLAA